MSNKMKIRSQTIINKSNKRQFNNRSYDQNSLTFQKINQILSNNKEQSDYNNQQNQNQNQNLKEQQPILYSDRGSKSQRQYNLNEQQQDQREDSQPQNQMQKIRSMTSNNFNPQSERNQQLFKNKWDKLNELNKKYFDHLKGDCRCKKCKCQRCRCNIRTLQIDYKKNPQTEYQAQIASEKQIEIQQMLPLDYEPYKDERTFDLHTIAQKSYEYIPAKNPIEEVTQINRNNLICGYQQIDQNTSYSKNFFEKTKPKQIKYYPLEQSLVPHSLKMDLKTESMKLSGRQNKKDYKIVNFAYERDKKLTPPLGVNIPMFSNTWYRTSNQNWFKNDNADQLAFNKENFRIKNTHISENQLITQDQFQSTAQKDYIQKPIEYCEQAQKPNDNINRLTRRAYMYRLYNETKGKFT